MTIARRRFLHLAAGAAALAVLTAPAATQAPSLAGKNEKEWAAGVDGVWGHFLDALRTYAGKPEALKRKPWKR